ncbi:MAG: FAD-dependent oxidoreductase [Nitrososphaerota archaeon]|nr:FAD-dependent oxidoreductase [Nitrososphaerota archaeon]
MAAWPEFDVVVVGAGPAGSACALTLARKGANVLLLEKGKIPGERNVSGGVVYGSYRDGYGLGDLLPGFEAEAPVERRIVSHEVFALSDPGKDAFSYYRIHRGSLVSRIGLFSTGLESGHDYSVLRRGFDRWMALKAVEAGAMLCTETTVEHLHFEGGRVAGVRTERDTITSRLVVDCSGVTSGLVQEAGLRGRLTPVELYHGVKHVYRLPAEKLEQRFDLRAGEGRAMFFLGEFMRGVSGGGFLYTNRDSVSVGVVSPLDSVVKATTQRFDRVGKPLDILEGMEGHPKLARLLEGAELLEYSAHNIPRGTLLETPYAPGFMAAGDALGTFVKMGALIDGMRRAIASGIMAAEAYLADDPGRYRRLLAPVYRDVGRSKRDSLLSESRLVYRVLPKVIFSTGLLAKKEKFSPVDDGKAETDASQRIQERTGLLAYDEDRSYSHIKVDQRLCSGDPTKPWVPTCPVNCYTLLTPKGVFASFRDLYLHNLKSSPQDRAAAFRQTLDDMGQGRLRFDHVACVACGTCGAIGPEEMVTFGHERSGHGVRYRHG